MSGLRNNSTEVPMFESSRVYLLELVNPLGASNVVGGWSLRSVPFTMLSELNKDDTQSSFGANNAVVRSPECAPGIPVGAGINIHVQIQKVFGRSVDWVMGGGLYVAS